VKYSIVGMQFRPDGTEAMVRALPDGAEVTLVREPTNGFDPNAVQVWVDDKHVGYIPKRENQTLAKTMDEKGKFAEVTGKFTRLGDGWPAVEID
jgi:HIRAN domain